MATRRARPATRATSTAEDVPVVGAREPCPCGSGRRYKACHGRQARAAAVPFVARPFEGLPGETDWVALREFVPAGTATLTFADGALDDLEVVASGSGMPRASVATLLPGIAPGLVTLDGEAVVALQTAGGSGDPSRDYAMVLERVLGAEPGTVIESVGHAEPGRRLQDYLDPTASFDVDVRDTFAFWAGTTADPDGLVAAAIERADQALTPTVRLPGGEAAYWCRAGDRDYLRWVLPESEDVVVDALARLHAAGADDLGTSSRLIGAFRAHGLLVAVWDLPTDGDAAYDAVVERWAESAQAFSGRYAEALAASAPLTAAERSARAGLVNRQRTLR